MPADMRRRRICGSEQHNLHKRKLISQNEMDLHYKSQDHDATSRLTTEYFCKKFPEFA
jgi:hypothetical protein